MITTHGKEMVEAYFANAVFAKNNLFLFADPGIGANKVIRECAEDAGLKLLDVRLNAIDSSDVSMNQFSNEFPIIPGSLRAMMENLDDNSVILLDEMSIAHPAAERFATELALTRKFGDFSLPEGVRIVLRNTGPFRGTYLLNRCIVVNLN